MSDSPAVSRSTSYTAVVGPTAVGKSDFALELAVQMLADGVPGVDIISVDSKQVYHGLEILSGADIPPGWSWLEPSQNLTGSRYTVFANPAQTIYLHGVSILTPDQEWSVAHFQQFAREIIDSATKSGRAVLFVGGTGLYYAHLFSTDPLLHVGPDLVLRQRVEQLGLAELQAEVQQQAPQRWQEMNHSDQQNPRRLIRVLEKELAKVGSNGLAIDDQTIGEQQNQQLIYLGLTADLAVLEARITARVHKRFEGGAVEEVERLLRLSPPATDQAKATLGVDDIQKFLAGESSAVDCQKNWALHEFQYAKRQLTWWKKQAVEWRES